MKKSLSTRIKITKKGKIIRRTMGQCHFRAKKTATQMRRRKTTKNTSPSLTKRIKTRSNSL